MMKTIGRILLTMAVLALASTMAFAASPLVGGGNQGGGEEALERELEGGIHLKLISVKREQSNHPYLWMWYVVTSDSDIQISIEGGAVFDSAGNKFNPDDYYYYIGNERTQSREIIANIPTHIGVCYKVWDDYELPSALARAELKINGKALIFRNVPIQ